MSAQVEHLDRAVELLWESGHPRIGEALEKEVRVLIAERDRLAAVCYPHGAEAAAVLRETEQ